MNYMHLAVRVLWRDAEAEVGWEFYRELQSKTLDVETIGYIVHTDDKSLTVAHSVSGTEKYPEQCNGRMTIPRECITEIEWLI